MNNLLSFFCIANDFCKNILSELEAKSLLIPSKKERENIGFHTLKLWLLLFIFIAQDKEILKAIIHNTSV